MLCSTLISLMQLQNCVVCFCSKQRTGERITNYFTITGACVAISEVNNLLEYGSLLPVQIYAMILLIAVVAHLQNPFIQTYCKRTRIICNACFCLTGLCFNTAFLHFAFNGRIFVTTNTFLRSTHDYAVSTATPIKRYNEYWYVISATIGVRCHFK